MTEDEVMTEADLDRDEFDHLYSEVLILVRRNGTHGVQTMLNFVERELIEGREFIE